MRQELYELILDYERNVAIACQKLRSQFQVKGDLGTWLEPRMPSPRRGLFDGSDTDSFWIHGIYCDVHIGARDFCFPLTPNIDCCFNKDSLVCFAKSCEAHCNMTGLDKLFYELQNLYKAGELVLIPSPNVFVDSSQPTPQLIRDWMYCLPEKKIKNLKLRKITDQC